MHCARMAQPTREHSIRQKEARGRGKKKGVAENFLYRLREKSRIDRVRRGRQHKTAGHRRAELGESETLVASLFVRCVLCFLQGCFSPVGNRVGDRGLLHGEEHERQEDRQEVSVLEHGCRLYHFLTRRYPEPVSTARIRNIFAYLWVYFLTTAFCIGKVVRF